MNYILFKNSIYYRLKFGLFPGDKNSSRQTRGVTYKFRLSVSFDARVGNWASTKEKPWTYIFFVGS